MFKKRFQIITLLVINILLFSCTRTTSNNLTIPSSNTAYRRIDISFDSSSFYDKEIALEPIKVLVSFSPYKSAGGLQVDEESQTGGTIRYQIFFNKNKYIDSHTDFTTSSASIYLQNLDDDEIPEVIIETFTGGTHCCTELKVYSWQGNKFLKSYLSLDGNADLFRDLDNDGNTDFITSDPRFFYKFSSYASSFPPTLILSFKAGKFVDTTRSQVQELRRTEQRMYEAFLESPKDSSEVNGILAGYVAQKILLGEYEDGWSFMLKNYNRNNPNFPTDLKAFLEEKGYFNGLKEKYFNETPPNTHTGF